MFKDAPNGSLVEEEENHKERREGEIVEEEVVVRHLEEDGSLGWRRVNSEMEVDRPSSPSSSGYAGERGSSNGGASSGSGIEEIGEDRVCDDETGNGRGEFFDGASDSQAPPWVPGKRHVNEVSSKINLPTIVYCFHGFCFNYKNLGRMAITCEKGKGE